MPGAIFLQGSRAHGFYHEQGVAFGFPEQTARHGRVEGTPCQVSGQVGCLGSIQRSERNLSHQSIAAQAYQQRLQGMLVRDFFCAYGSNEQQPRVFIETQQIVQPLDGLAVTPLDIIQQQQGMVVA